MSAVALTNAAAASGPLGPLIVECVFNSPFCLSSAATRDCRSMTICFSCPISSPFDCDRAGESQWRTDADFLYHNRVPAGTILAAGRSVKVVLTLLFGGFIAWWTRSHFGAVPALAALLLFAFDPTFIAHGHLRSEEHTS